MEDNKLIERIEKAAREGAFIGAKQGARQGAMGLSGTPVKLVWLLVVGIFFVWVITSLIPRLNPFYHLQAAFEKEEDMEGHDLTLENHGILGYTVADFEDAILGDSTQLKKLEVFSMEVSDMAKLTKAGLGKFKAFSKYQYITYHGKAIYTVDLGLLNKDSISYDEESKEVKVLIPKPVREEITVYEDQTEFGDVKNGILSFGEIKLTPEESNTIQAEAKKKMAEKLEKENTIEEAKRFAKLSVWEIYQPIVTGVSPDCKLEVDFIEE